MAADLLYEGRIIIIGRFWFLQTADIHVLNGIYKLGARNQQIMVSTLRRSKYEVVLY